MRLMDFLVAYVLNTIHQIVEVRHLMQERGCQLEDGSIKVLGVEIDFPILRTAGVPYLVDTAPAIRPAPSVRGYSDGGGSARLCKNAD